MMVCLCVCLCVMGGIAAAGGRGGEGGEGGVAKSRDASERLYSGARAAPCFFVVVLLHVGVEVISKEGKKRGGKEWIATRARSGAPARPPGR